MLRDDPRAVAAKPDPLPFGVAHTGVQDMPAQAYEQSGQRLAHSGYHQQP